MTRITEYEQQFLNKIQKTIDDIFTKLLDEHYDCTTVAFYELISEYYSQLADNERAKIKIVPPTNNDNWKLEL